MLWFLIALMIGPAVYGTHRLALWAEDRGWIYYKNPRAPLGSYGMALIDATSMFAPEVEHVIEEQQAEEHRAEVTESGNSFGSEGIPLGSVDFD